MKSAIQKAVQSVVNKSLADIPVQVILTTTSLGNYDPVTGSATKTVEEVSVKAVLTGITDKDTNDLELLTKGKKALVAGLDMRGINLDAVDDYVVINDEKYKLKSHKVDPAGALYTLMLVAWSPSGRGV